MPDMLCFLRAACSALSALSECTASCSACWAGDTGCPHKPLCSCWKAASGQVHHLRLRRHCSGALAGRRLLLSKVDQLALDGSRSSHLHWALAARPGCTGRCWRGSTCCLLLCGCPDGLCWHLKLGKQRAVLGAACAEHAAEQQSRGRLQSHTQLSHQGPIRIVLLIQQLTDGGQRAGLGDQGRVLPPLPPCAQRCQRNFAQQGWQWRLQGAVPSTLRTAEASAAACATSTGRGPRLGPRS